MMASLPTLTSLGPMAKIEEGVGEVADKEDHRVPDEAEPAEVMIAAPVVSRPVPAAVVAGVAVATVISAPRGSSRRL